MKTEKEVVHFELENFISSVAASHPIQVGFKKSKVNVSASSSELADKPAKWYVKKALNKDHVGVALYVGRCNNQGKVAPSSLEAGKSKFVFLLGELGENVGVFYIDKEGMCSSKGSFTANQLSTFGLSLKTFPVEAGKVELFDRCLSQGLLQRFQEESRETHPAFSDFCSELIKSEENWKLALEGETKLALLEVSLREFARLMNPHQMKTRLARGKDGHLWVASKELPGYENLQEYLRKDRILVDHKAIFRRIRDEVQRELAEEFRQKGLTKDVIKRCNKEIMQRYNSQEFWLKYAEEDRQSLKKAIEDGSCRGLGHASFMAAFLNEVDFKLDNLGRDQDGNLIMHDLGFSLSYLHCTQFPEEKITEAVIANLPKPPASVYNWLSVVAGAQPYCTLPSLEDFGALKDHLGLRREINESMLNILVLPDLLIKTFFKYYTENVDQAFGEVIYNKILQKKQELREAAFANPSFQAYLMSPDAALQFDAHKEYVNSFFLTGKNKLASSNLMTEMQQEFHGLQASMLCKQAGSSSTVTMLISMPGTSSGSSPSSLHHSSARNDFDDQKPDSKSKGEEPVNSCEHDQETTRTLSFLG